MTEFLASYIRARKYDIARMLKMIDAEQNPEIKARLVRRVAEAKRLVNALQNQLDEVKDERFS